MSSPQFYLSMGIPTLAVLISTVLLVQLFASLGKRIDRLVDRMNGFEGRMDRFEICMNNFEAILNEMRLQPQS